MLSIQPCRQLFHSQGDDFAESFFRGHIQIFDFVFREEEDQSRGGVGRCWDEYGYIKEPFCVCLSFGDKTDYIALAAGDFCRSQVSPFAAGGKGLNHVFKCGVPASDDGDFGDA